MGRGHKQEVRVDYIEEVKIKQENIETNLLVNFFKPSSIFSLSAP
jgi:hypothetical protein